MLLLVKNSPASTESPAAMSARNVCPPCGSQRYQKNGYTRHGTQNHPCKACHRQLTAPPLDRSIAPEQRLRIEQLLCERISLRGICRAVGVRLPWLLHLLVECFTACPEDLHAQPPPGLSPWGCRGWQRKPMRWGASSRSRRTNNGFGSPWMRPPARSLRCMGESGVARVARSSGRTCRRSTVHRRHAIPTNMKSIKA